MDSVNREDFRRDAVPYLGWYFEGAFGRPVVPRTYCWFATEDCGEGKFVLKLDLTRTRHEDLEGIIDRGLSIARAKVFLGSWEQGKTYSGDGAESGLTTEAVRNQILVGLHGLYEAGFAKSDVKLDFEGLALELGVTAEKVERATEFLFDGGLVSHPGTLGLNWQNGHVWITSAGVSFVEGQMEAAESGTATTKQPALVNQDIPNKVMVVHGRNMGLRDDLFGLLSALGVGPLEWSQAVAMTGKASPYVGEVLDAAFRAARAVVVLLSGDDMAFLRSELAEDGDRAFESEPTPQARPNVLFEAGMAFAVHPDRTILLEVGNLRPFSDVAGRHVLRALGPTWRHELAERLKTAGCDVDLTGTRWLTVGAFEPLTLLESRNEVAVERPRTESRPVDDREGSTLRRRQDAVSEVYVALAEAHDAMGRWTRIYRPNGAPSEVDDGEVAAAAYDSFLRTLNRQRLWLGPELATRAEACRDALHDAWADFVDPESRDWKSVRHTMNERVPALRREFEGAAAGLMQ